MQTIPTRSKQLSGVNFEILHVDNASAGSNPAARGYAYTFLYQIPKDATGTWTIGIEGTKVYTLNSGTVAQTTQSQGGGNKLLSFSVDGTPVHARRTVVSLENCNSCHSSLSAHGGNHNQIEMCVLCHNPNATDRSQRPAANNPPQAIDFRTMVHKIHTGENLTSDYTIFGYQGSKNNGASGYLVAAGARSSPPQWK